MILLCLHELICAVGTTVLLSWSPAARAPCWLPHDRHGDGGLVPKMCPTRRNPMNSSPTRFLYPWGSPGKNTGVGCHFLLQGIFLTQGSNPGLLHWQADSSPLSRGEAPVAVAAVIRGSCPEDRNCYPFMSQRTAASIQNPLVASHPTRSESWCP